jgi:hypothetical protein
MANTLVANPFQTLESAGPSAGTEIAQVREAQEAQAMVAVAKRFLRDPVQAMDRILQACTRPSLAETSMYQYNRGGSDICEPSIHLAQTMAQCWGNIDYGFKELSRRTVNGIGHSEVSAFAWDLETNLRKSIVFTVKHWRDTKSGGYPIKDERDIYELMANMASRRTRNCLLSVIPRDVTEAAQRQCEVTLSAHADTSPEAVKKLLEAFSQFGVTRAQIEARLQRRIDSITPALMIQMRKIFTSLRDGMSGVNDWFPPVGGDAKPASTLKDRLRGSADAEPSPAPVEEAAPVEPTVEDEPPQMYTDFIDALQAAPNLTVVKTLRVRVMAMPEPWQTKARQAYNARLAESTPPAAA